MALFERIARRKDNGQPMTDADMVLHIPATKFHDALWQIIGSPGFETSAQVKTKLGIRTEVDASGRSDAQDWDALAAGVPSQTANQAFYVERVTAVLRLLSLSTRRESLQYPGLTTPNQARTRLGVPVAPGSL